MRKKPDSVPLDLCKRFDRTTKKKKNWIEQQKFDRTKKKKKKNEKKTHTLYHQQFEDKVIIRRSLTAHKSHCATQPITDIKKYII